jgi:hypothetical protein
LNLTRIEFRPLREHKLKFPFKTFKIDRGGNFRTPIAQHKHNSQSKTVHDRLALDRALALEELVELEVVQAQDARVDSMGARAAPPDHVLGLEDRQEDHIVGLRQVCAGLLVQILDQVLQLGDAAPERTLGFRIRPVLPTFSHRRSDKSTNPIVRFAAPPSADPSRFSSRGAHTPLRIS